MQIVDVKNVCNEPRLTNTVLDALSNCWRVPTWCHYANLIYAKTKTSTRRIVDPIHVIMVYLDVLLLVPWSRWMLTARSIAANYINAWRNWRTNVHVWRRLYPTTSMAVRCRHLSNLLRVHLTIWICYNKCSTMMITSTYWMRHPIANLLTSTQCLQRHRFQDYNQHPATCRIWWIWVIAWHLHLSIQVEHLLSLLFLNAPQMERSFATAKTLDSLKVHDAWHGNNRHKVFKNLVLLMLYWKNWISDHPHPCMPCHLLQRRQQQQLL